MSTTAKPRARLKARRMFTSATFYGGPTIHVHKKAVPYLRDHVPVAVIPLDDVEALACTLARGWMNHAVGTQSRGTVRREHIGAIHMACARAALTALGLLPARRGKKAK